MERRGRWNTKHFDRGAMTFSRHRQRSSGACAISMLFLPFSSSLFYFYFFVFPSRIAHRRLARYAHESSLPEVGGEQRNIFIPSGGGGGGGDRNGGFFSLFFFFFLLISCRGMYTHSVEEKPRRANGCGCKCRCGCVWWRFVYFTRNNCNTFATRGRRSDNY